MSRTEKTTHVPQDESLPGRTLLEAAPVIVLVLTPAGLIEYVNPTFERLSGWRLDELKGKNWFTTCLPDRVREAVGDVINAVLFDQPTGNHVNPIVTRSGEEREIEWHNQALEAPAGSAPNVLSIGVDVTEQRRSASRESERLRRLAHLAEMSLVLSGSSVAVMTRLVGMVATLFAVRVVALTEPTDKHLRFIVSSIDGVYGTMDSNCPLSVTPCNTVVDARDVRVYDNVADRFPDAPFLSEHHATAYCGVPVIGRDNDVIAVMCLLHDQPRDFPPEDQHLLRIVAQRIAFELERGKHTAFREQAEANLAKSEARLRQAQAIAHLGNWELDITSGQLWWSEEVFRLFERDQARFGASYEAFLDAIHPDDRERVHRAYTQSLTDRTSYHITHRLLGQDGSARIVEERCETDFAEDGTPVRSRGTVQDVTDRVETENALRESLVEKEILLREVHHRVKNNLQIISTLLKLQAKQVRDPKDLDAFLDANDRVRAMAMVHETLYASGGFSKVDFADYLRTLIGELQRSYAPRQLAPVQLRAERVMLSIEQALPCGLLASELLTNVFKHAFPPGSSGDVSVQLSSQDGHVTLVVRDTGVGWAVPASQDSVPSFGWQLIRALATQLSGATTVERDGGTAVTISFPTAPAADHGYP